MDSGEIKKLVLIENNNQVNVGNLNEENSKESGKDNELINKDKVDNELIDKDEIDIKLNKSSNEEIKTNTLNHREIKVGLFKTTRSSSFIQHPLNTSLSNNDISSSSTLASNLNLTCSNKQHLIEPIFNEQYQNASPNSTTQRQSSILNNFNDWLTNISSGSLFQNFLFANPFKRRGSRIPGGGLNSPIISRSNSKAVIERQILKDDSFESTNSSDSFDQNASFLIGTLKPTLKNNELIELANFGIVEIDAQETGLGHRFEFYPLSSHTFCDNCSEFIWTPIIHHSDTLNNQFISPLSQTVRCINCKYVCHYKCSKFVRIGCQKQLDQSSIEFKDLNSNKQNGLEKDKDSPPLFDLDILEQKIQKYNERIAHKGSGLGIYLLEDKKTFRGFFRVHLNLTRPINVVAGVRPPSIYDILKEEETSQSRRTLTTFYMPRDTVKNIHINSKNTSIDVIKAMLKKFKMVDNHQKFALYKRYTDENQKVILSRINDLDYPLKIALDWLDSDEKQFILQENDTADVNWGEFQLPELFNFLKILDREEREHMQQVKNKYNSLRDELEKLISYKEIFTDAVYV